MALNAGYDTSDLSFVRSKVRFGKVFFCGVAGGCWKRNQTEVNLKQTPKCFDFV